MTRKGKKKQQKQEDSADASSSSSSAPQQQQAGGQQQQQRQPPPVAQQQPRQPPPGAQKQQPRQPPPGAQQQQPRQPPPGAQQPRQPPPGAQQQRQPPPGAQQQWPRQPPPGVQQQQPRQPPPAAWGQVRQPPPGPPQQQQFQRPPGAWGGQPRQPPPGAHQQQMRQPPPGAHQQQMYQPPPGAHQQQMYQPPPGAHQQQMYQPPPGAHQQQMHQPPPGAHQQQMHQPPPGAHQQQMHQPPPGAHQQQMYQPPPGAQQQPRQAAPGAPVQSPPTASPQQQPQDVLAAGDSASAGRGRGRSDSAGTRGKGAGRGKGTGRGDRSESGHESSKSPEGSITEVSKKMSEVSIESKVKKVAGPRGSPIKSTIPADVAQRLALAIPKRSNMNRGGTMGRPIEVETNMLEIIFGPKFRTDAVHYDLEIDPDKPKFLIKSVFEAIRKQYFPKRYPAFDGRKNVFSASNLPFGESLEAEITVHDPERQQDKVFKIKMQKVANVDLSWLKDVRPGMCETEKEQIGLQVLDVILRQGAMMHSTAIVGRSFFTPPQGRVVSLTNGMDLWVGMFQSAVLAWKPYLNIDVAHKGFPTPQNVINLMNELGADPRRRDARGPTVADIVRSAEDISKFLKSLKVQYEIPGIPSSKRTYRVNGLGPSAREHEFQLDNGSRTTIERYYAQEKRYTIQHPMLPCVWVGATQRRVYVPAELCTILPGQAKQRKLDESQTSKMIREAATSTSVRKEKIMNCFQRMPVNNNPTMTDEFKLSVDGRFARVPARVLDAPSLEYKRNTTVQAMKGTWRAKHFLDACALEQDSWTILNLNKHRTPEGQLYDFKTKLQRGASTVGMTIGEPATPFVALDPPGRDIRQLRNYFEERKHLKLIIVIIPDRNDVYSKVKQVSELNIGVLTQCLKSQTLQDRKLSDATIGNILLKINSKLNGVNHTIGVRPKCLDVPCMLVGADVTHPSPDSIGIPSIAAVAASHDPKAFKYNIEIRLQPPRTEIIQDLDEIMQKQLMFFYKQTSHKPQRIIFYRDGVSEGQLPQVMYHELEAMKKAFKRLQADGSYRPKITFLVVQKRHHVRLFPTDPKNSDDRNFNVQAGTIVDTNITHPSHIDFYLVSHASIQGTARPTKYRCICNEIGMSEDEIEQLTYYLCHMFARCTRSVSYPTPTYYAHLAAFRARALTFDTSIQVDQLEDASRRLFPLHSNMGKLPMFFV